MADSDSVLWGVEWGVLWDIEGCFMVVECILVRLVVAVVVVAVGLEKGYFVSFMFLGYFGNLNGGCIVFVMI